MSKMPDKLKKIYKVGNIIKRTFIHTGYYAYIPHKHEAIKIIAVYSEIHNSYPRTKGQEYIFFDGHTYRNDVISTFRSMYFKNEKHIKDELISYIDAVTITL